MNNAQGQTAGFADNADANQMYHLAERVAKLEGAVPHSATKADINQLREEITALRGEVKNNFTKVNARIDSIEKRLDRVEERLDRLEARFDQLEKQMDKRFFQQNCYMHVADRLCGAIIDWRMFCALNPFCQSWRIKHESSTRTSGRICRQR